MGEIKPREIPLGQGAHIRIRTASDAAAILDLYRFVLAEGRYTLLLLEELQRTEEMERKAIANEIERPGGLRVVAEVDGLIAGMARGGSANFSVPRTLAMWIQSGYTRIGEGEGSEMR